MRSNQLSYPAIAESECKDKRKIRSCKIFSIKIGKNPQKRPLAPILTPCGQTLRRMPLKKITRERLTRILGSVNVAGGLVLLAAMSREILGGNHARFSDLYLHVQLIVCSLFLADFVVRWMAAERRGRFFARHCLFLIISIPYLNLIEWSGIELPREAAMLIGLMPLVRLFLAFYIVIRWLAGDRVRKLLAAYVLTVALFTYLSALVFYDYEAGVNPRLHGFGDAVWRAWMNVTTVGAEIFPVTTVGKVFSVLLPSLGMLFFPIFTTYVLQEYAPRKKESDRQ